MQTAAIEESHQQTCTKVEEAVCAQADCDAPVVEINKDERDALNGGALDILLSDSGEEA